MHWCIKASHTYINIAMYCAAFDTILYQSVFDTPLCIESSLINIDVFLQKIHLDTTMYREYRSMYIMMYRIHDTMMHRMYGCFLLLALPLIDDDGRWRWLLTIAVTMATYRLKWRLPKRGWQLPECWCWSTTDKDNHWCWPTNGNCR